MDIDNNHDDFIEHAMAIVMRTKKPQTIAGSVKGGRIIVNHATLSYCQLALAKLIHEDGKKAYLPIFERITLELEKLERDRELENLAMDLVAQNTLSSDTRHNLLC